MKTLYLHMGTQKTGTSSLQYFCGQNRAVLQGLGYEYPIVPVTYAFVDKWRNGHFLMGHIFDEQGKRDMGREAQARETGFAVVADAFESYDNVVLSDENLFDYSMREPGMHWDELLEHTRKWGCEVKAIVYLRRQDQLVLSRYNQKVKMGDSHGGKLTWSRWVERLPGLELDYLAVLERISSHIGKQNVDVHVYDRAQLERDGGNLYTDFLGCLGLRMEQGFKEPEADKNARSLTPNILAIKRAVNSSPYFTRGQGSFRRAAEACSSLPAGAPRMSLFSPEEARAFMLRYEEGNNRIAAEYLHREGPLFSTDVAEAETWSVDNPWMHDDLVRFFQQVNAFQAAGARKNAKAGRGVPAAGEPLDTTTWLAYVEELPVAKLGVYGYAARCLGDLFIFRSRCIKQGVAINELDDTSIAYLVDLLLAHARKLEALEGEVTQVNDALKQQRATLSSKVSRVFADPASGVRYVCRKVRGR